MDRFKQLNDNYGHRTGDDALVSVAHALRDTTDDTASSAAPAARNS
ncbi:diguanylate cyclase domain-containing protein [Mycobacterium sp.]